MSGIVEDKGEEQEGIRTGQNDDEEETDDLPISLCFKRDPKGREEPESSGTNISAPPRIRAPAISERVVGHYSNILFSAGRVVGVNARTMTYTVDWDNEELEQVSSFQLLFFFFSLFSFLFYFHIIYQQRGRSDKIIIYYDDNI